MTIKPKGESRATTLRVDGWIKDGKILIEAKSSCTRNQIRLAIGQLLDYKRYLNPKQMAILLPTKPKSDLIELIKSLEDKYTCKRCIRKRINTIEEIIKKISK